MQNVFVTVKISLIMLPIISWTQCLVSVNHFHSLKVKNKSKEGKKLKKKQQQPEEQEEDPDCDPPAPKKKKKKDKLAADQANGHINEAADLNGNSEDVVSPKKTKKKKKEASEVSTMMLFICISTS